MDRTNAIKKLYSESLEYLFKHDSTAGMTCSSDSHLAIVYLVLFKHSHKYVHIFHGQLSILSNENVLREVQRAIERGVGIKCIVGESPSETAFEKLLPKGNFKAESTNKPFSFMAMDGRALYWNTESKISARVYVNNSEIAEILEAHFKQVWAK